MIIRNVWSKKKLKQLAGVKNKIEDDFCNISTFILKLI